MTTEDDIEAYNAERNAAVIAGVDALIAFMAKRGMQPSSREVAEIILHRVRTAIKSLPIEMRRASRQWLIQRRYRPWDDGDL
ncbi:hypothetical protein I6F35_06230 [Bradyrhizobium sp. BRP22]|uniref:hypothetical protein n=1 Tax=Bradyrhizobium sp. BRP22 TaxID=2793821 RepID=UPI001CD1A2CD|nr:hypothetical protein [Bradyrhizobium sp. BRP22]MCA1452817.1 hypothetical protein [Bradyrhizobium sp. BRP22]